MPPFFFSYIPLGFPFLTFFPLHLLKNMFLKFLFNSCLYVFVLLFYPFLIHFYLLFFSFSLTSLLYSVSLSSFLFLQFFIIFIFFFFFFFLGLQLQHMEVPKLGSPMWTAAYWPQPQQRTICTMSVTYTTAGDNAGSFNPLSKGSDWTCILMDSSWILNPLSHHGNTSNLLFFIHLHSFLKNIFFIFDTFTTVLSLFLYCFTNTVPLISCYLDLPIAYCYQ